MTPVPAQGDAGRVDRGHGSDRVPLDARHRDQAADRVAGQPEVVLDTDSAAFSTCSGVPPSNSASAPAAIEQADPTSPWQPASAPEMEAFSLNKEPIAAAVSRKRVTPSADAPDTNRS